MVEMEKSLLKKLCRDHDLYVTPSINDKLYLHYKGFRCIKNLDEYTGLKVLWLEGNGLPRIEGLEHQKLLKTLYLQENLIHKIENLDVQSGLDTLNLSQNQISCIENLGHMKELTSLSLKSNYLATAQDIEHVLELPNLSVLDVQSNRITDPEVLEVFAKMPNLKVLYLQGNDVVKHIKQYRKTLVYRCRKLKYLDDRPVFDDERRRIDAWGKVLDASNGDYKAAQEAERVEMEAIRQEKKDRDRMNFLHFEQLMAEGRRKRAEEAEKDAQKASHDNNQANQDSQPVEVNPFSGEKIVPVQDCEFLQRQREQRWEQVVNAPDAWPSGGKTTTAANASSEKEQVSATSSVEDNQTESAAPPVTQVQEAIPVDASRLALLHQCATVGAGAVAARDAFVDSAFRTVEAPAPPSGLLPPPAPVASSSGQRELKERERGLPYSQQPPSSFIPTAEVAELMPPATQLVNCPVFVVDAEEAADETAAAISSAASTSAVIMPPPAPVAAVTKPSTHTTDVNELD